MLEQHGRSYPIIPDAAKQRTVCDPGQVSALRVCPEMLGVFFIHTRRHSSIFFKFLLIFVRKSDEK